MRLAEVWVDSGASSIPNAKITDKRVGASFRLPYPYFRYNSSRLQYSNDGGVTYTDLANVDGWTSFTGNGTRVSATSFTVAGDQTGVFKKGTKIKYTDTTTKYNVVMADATYSSGVTTVVLAPTDDFAVVGTTITGISYSYQENPVGWPDWFAYTPTYTGFATPPSGGVVKYAVRGKTCFFTKDINGSAGSSNNTIFTLSVPIPAVADAIGICWAKDNGGNLSAPSEILIAAGQTAMSIYKTFHAGAWTALNSGKDVYIPLFAYQI